MALLISSRTQQTVIVEAELLIGRSSACALRIGEPYVSARHATLRWDGEGWEVKDLGSRNGTFLNGTRLSLRIAHRLSRGDELAFGDEGEVWKLVNDDPPPVMAVPVGGGEPVLAEHDVLGIPSPSDPQATIYRDVDGLWKLELADGESTILEQQRTFHVGGRVYRFSCPDVMGATTTLRGVAFGPNVALRFSVSRDEEYVQLAAVQGDRVVDLGSRNHNYLLLTLARARRDDAANGVAESSCGWVYQEDLLTALRTSSAQLNIDVFRIRQHFAKAGFSDVVKIIERRPSSKQLRIGVAALEIRSI